MLHFNVNHYNPSEYTWGSSVVCCAEMPEVRSRLAKVSLVLMALIPSFMAKLVDQVTGNNKITTSYTMIMYSHT